MKLVEQILNKLFKKTQKRGPSVSFKFKMKSFLIKVNSSSKEQKLLFFFGFVLFVLFSRLFFLQVVYSEYYNNILYSQHYTQSLLKAQRGDVFVNDKAGNSIKLTENIDLYTIFVDPKFVKNKEKLISIMSPLLYEHFCELNGLEKPEKYRCVTNLEKYTGEKILKDEDSFFYISGDNQEVIVDFNKTKEENDIIVSNFSQEQGTAMITKKLRDKIRSGIRSQNYFGFFDNQELLDEFEQLKLPYISLADNYIYFVPGQVTDVNSVANKLSGIFEKHGYNYDLKEIISTLQPREIRYIRLASNINSQIAKKVKELKTEYYTEKIEGIPLLHGVGLEKYERRYYPHGDFLSHVLGYVDKNGAPFYGVEQYFDHILKGKDGKIIGLSVPWIGAIGSNEVDVSNPVDGSDIYLTIDFGLQKEVEKLLKYYYNELNPDSISVLVMDPYTGKIKASANYPNFDPNLYEEVYKIKPLTYEDAYLIEPNSTYVDIPVMISTGDNLRNATFDERESGQGNMYVFNNLLGPSVFVDKNIGFPYEPGSVFKAFTIGIGIDVDEIGLFDFYEDKGKVEVGPYTITNVSNNCNGEQTFANALMWSCNVGMVRIAQRVQKYIFYNYLNKLGFGKLTGVELFGEDPGEISALTNFSKARFFNNSFGQGLLTTPIQVAVGYSAMVNGGYLIKPTIVEKLHDKASDKIIQTEKKVQSRIFKEDTTEYVKEALYRVVADGGSQGLQLGDYTLGGKSGTSQIAFRGKYQKGRGWTNGSFVGITTKNDLRNVIAIQVRRPRTCEWGSCTAGKIFKDIAKILIENEGIKE